MSITIPTQPSDKLRCPNCGGSMKIANKRIAELQAQVDSNLALVTCGACGSGTATSNELLVNKRIAELQSQLDKYKTALEKLARLGNGDRYGNSEGNCIAQQALEQKP